MFTMEVAISVLSADTQFAMKITASKTGITAVNSKR